MPALTQLLGQLEAMQLLQRLEEMDAAYQFHHSLTRDSAYGSLLRKQRRDLHRRVAECYEQLYPTRLEEFAAQLAYHLDEAGEVRAWQYYRLAGDGAFRLYASTEAIAHYERAITLAAAADGVDPTDLLHLFLRRGRALELLGQFEAALNDYAALEQTGRTQGRDALVLAGLVEQCQLRATPNPLFDANQAKGLAEQALALAARLDDKAAEARIYWSLLNVGRFTADRHDQARDYGDRALALAREQGLRELESYILNDIADIYMMAGHPRQAHKLLTEAGVLFRELGNLPMLADNLASASGFEVFTDHDEAALALSDEAFAISLSIGNVWGQSYSRSLIGYVYWDRGEVQRAIDVTETSIRQALEVGFVAATTFSGALLGLIYGDLGAVERARQAMVAGWQAADGPMAAFRSALLATEVALSILEKDLPRAEAALRELESNTQTRNPYMLIGYVGAPAQLALAQGRFADALQHTEGDIALLVALDMDRVLPDILLQRAQALVGLGREKEARPVLLQAIERAERSQHRRILWQLQASLAKLEASEGRADEAAALMAQARAHIETISSNISDPDLVASFRSRPEVKAVLQA